MVDNDRPDSPASTYRLDHSLWRLRKGSHVAEARARMDVTGPVLAFYIDGALVWHERFRQDRGAALGKLAEAKRVEFLDMGWTS